MASAIWRATRHSPASVGPSRAPTARVATWVKATSTLALALVATAERQAPGMPAVSSAGVVSKPPPPAMASIKPATKATAARMARVVRSTLSSKGMGRAYYWQGAKREAVILPV